ncbi:uncharacterized protein [Pleurodeles waltl]|uniref:uncharacterized protein n=1 Tax=Pleurodeles waltl TaxID=8319 RepID=UPI003709BB5D
MVFISGWEDRLCHLREVLQVLQIADHTIKVSKRQIGLGSVVYLGHQEGGGIVFSLWAKIETNLLWKPPKTQTEVRAFSGLTGYYKRFIKGYGNIVALLRELTFKKQPCQVIWTEECQITFDTLKEAMCTAPYSTPLTSPKISLSRQTP